MVGVLAQVPTEQVCGPTDEAAWLCELVHEATGQQVLARLAGGADVLVRVVVIVVLAFVASHLARRLVRRFAQRMERTITERLERNQARGVLPHPEQYRDRRLTRLQAIAGAMQGGAAALIWIIAILAIIQAFGIGLQPVLAGAGLLGVIFGFGAQQLVRDVLAGIAMLVEDQYGVGDWIDVEGAIGQVERVGLRATSFRDLDGVQWHVLNGYIQRVGNLSQEWGRMTFDIPMALDTDVPTAKEVISKVATELTHDPLWRKDIIGPHEIWGVQDFGPEGIKIRVVIPTRPMANWDIKRQMRERINHAFAQAGIRQPGVLLDVGGRAPDTNPVQQVYLRPDRRPADGEGPADSEGDSPAATAREVTGETPAQHRDETRQLRIKRGSQPRPD